MKTAATVSASVTIIVLALVSGGCRSSMQARSVDISKAMLVNPSLLTKGTGDQAIYRYVNPKADIRKYSKIMIDPVLVEKQGELDEKELKNYQTLANNAYVYLRQELEKDYRIVENPDAGTMRIQIGIIDADTSKPVRNVLSSVTPIGIGLSLVKYGASGKQSGVGEITGEFKVTDAMTGELLGAALDRRVGGKNVAGVFDTWHNANEALKYWAQRARYVLCTGRGEANCVEP